MELAIVVILIVIAIAAGALFASGGPSDKPRQDSASEYETPTTDTEFDFSMLPQEFVVLDLETTGLNPEKNEIIEFGAIRVNVESENHKGFQTLVKPTGRVPKKITEITGITQSMIDQDGASLPDALKDFMEFIEDLPLVTYNADFDMSFLWAAAGRHGVEINNRYTCALKLARRAWPGLPSYRLVDLAKMANLSADDTHRALGDCKRTAIIFTSAARTLGKKVRWSHPTSKSKTPRLVRENNQQA